MITELILRALGTIAEWLSSWLPESDLDLPAGLEDWGDKLGQYIGPADSFLPITELAVFLQLFFGIWMPASAIYVTGMWVLTHLPIPGGG